MQMMFKGKRYRTGDASQTVIKWDEQSNTIQIRWTTDKRGAQCFLAINLPELTYIIGLMMRYQVEAFLVFYKAFRKQQWIARLRRLNPIGWFRRGGQTEQVPDTRTAETG